MPRDATVQALLDLLTGFYGPLLTAASVPAAGGGTGGAAEAAVVVAAAAATAAAEGGGGGGVVGVGAAPAPAEAAEAAEGGRGGAACIAFAKLPSFGPALQKLRYAQTDLPQRALTLAALLRSVRGARGTLACCIASHSYLPKGTLTHCMASH